MLKKAALFLMTGLAATGVMDPRPAEACLINLCRNVTNFPPEKAPANLLGGLADYYIESGFQAAHFELHRVDGDEEITVPISLHGIEHRGVEWRLEEQLEQGGTYRLRGENECWRIPEEDRRWEHYFETVEPAPLPSRLGNLEVEQTFKDNLFVRASFCEPLVVISADQIVIALKPREEVLPWWDLLEFSTYVNGELWTSNSSEATHCEHCRRRAIGTEDSWAVRGTELLFTRCEYDDTRSPPGLAEGTYTVKMHGRILGSNLLLMSDSIEVTLSCDDVPSPRFDRKTLADATRPLPSLAIRFLAFLALAAVLWGWWSRGIIDRAARQPDDLIQ